MAGDPGHEKRSLRSRKDAPACLVPQKDVILSKRKRQLARVLRKSSSDRSELDLKLLKEFGTLIEDVKHRVERSRSLKSRSLEIEDDVETVKSKCKILADAVINSDNVVIYTGAGISTAAQIPDYRGPMGVWTLQKKKKDIKNVNLVDASPTFTHLAITKLVQEGIVKHVVSQNCDGLHVRSGLPINQLSEIHGNIYIEYCKSCGKQFWRDFDVTVKSARNRHSTGRFCDKCKLGKLQDTIVHFGEKGKLEQPLNWRGAIEAASKANVIICLGSSLTILRKYKCLWPKRRSSFKLFIVNLQWTPKDAVATLKINAKCDFVLQELTRLLEIDVPEYKLANDPLRELCKPIIEEESNCTHRHLFESIKSVQGPEIKSSWFGKGLKTQLRTSRRRVRVKKESIE